MHFGVEMGRPELWLVTTLRSLTVVALQVMCSTPVALVHFVDAVEVQLSAVD
jgi:hypothetical protein